MGLFYYLGGKNIPQRASILYKAMVGSAFRVPNNLRQAAQWWFL